MVMSVLSQRGEKISHNESLEDTCDNLLLNKTKGRGVFDQETNPQGVVHMWMALNELMNEELGEKIKKGLSLKEFSNYQHYFNYSGTNELKHALISLLEKHFNPAKSLKPENLVIMNGVASIQNALAHALLDEGDMIICPAPAYTRMYNNFTEIAGVEVLPLHLVDKSGSENDPFPMHPGTLDKTIQKLKDEGKRVGAFVFHNPNNPLGVSYPSTLVKQLLEICAKHEVHYVSDEIFALSRHSGDGAQESILSVDSLPDTRRTHFLWGVSKDFALSGLRIGMIYSECKEVIQCMKVMTSFMNTASIGQHIVAILLSDTEWRDFYIRTNQQKLRQRYKETKSRLSALGVKVMKAEAGFYIWIRLSSFMKEETTEAEMELFEELLSGGVCISPGSKMHCIKPGWFRVVFSQPEPVYKEGMKRLEAILASKKN